MNHPSDPVPGTPLVSIPQTMSIDRNELRRQMRAQRRALTPSQRTKVGIGIARVISRLHLLRPGRRIGAYLAHAGEADLATTLKLAQSRRCRIYLPAITHRRSNRMEFVRFEPRSQLRRNLFGIAEPDVRRARRIAARELDLILVPLVAVDPWGTRLGSGAGFYDRRLHRLRADRHWRRPRLIGIAYEFQRVTRLTPQPWDVPLDAVITDRGCYPALRHEPTTQRSS